jgi:3-oxoacyl-[acyl-carrier-protein] synthase III
MPEWVLAREFFRPGLEKKGAVPDDGRRSFCPSRAETARERCGRPASKGAHLLQAIQVYLIAAASAFGSRILPSEEVDKAYGMPIGKLRARAGILSVAYAGENETEDSLAADACQKALEQCGESSQNLDAVIVASETHHAYPSLAAVLHARLKMPEWRMALDAGNGCLALLQVLFVAQALVLSGRAEKILAATADVHSRTLGPGRSAGEFGGLFGDGASAFLVSSKAPEKGRFGYQLGEFFFGLASQYAEAIAVCEAGGGELEVQFDGEGLSRAAVNRMEQVLSEVERRSGIPREQAGAFATHQPNPRLVKLLAKQLDVPASAFPPICETKGNLGPTMCGAALQAAFANAAARPAGERGAVFLASLAPGLLFGGGWMVPVEG